MNLTRPKLLSACLLLLLTAAAPTPQQVEQAERARAAQLDAARAAAAKAAASTAEEQLLTAQRVAAAAKLRDLESATADAAAQVAALAQRRAAAKAKLDARAADLGPMLPVIERLSLYPAETLLAVPMPPEQAVRGLLVLGGLTHQLEADAASLRAEQADVDALQAQIDAKMPALTAAQSAQSAAETALDNQIATAQFNRKTAENAGADALRAAATQAALANNLRAAIAQIDAARRAAEARAKAAADAAVKAKQDAAAQAARQQELALARPAGPGIGSAHGGLTAPVAGNVIRGFGDPGDGGPSTGLSYQAPPGARVVSPCGGRVVFAAPFRSFGLLMIVDCGANTHFVLSGLGRLDAQVGQNVAAGEPVGLMPSWDPRSTADRPLLYLELRENGQPVNPAPFLRAKG